MKVTRYDHALRFLVASRTRKAEHLVELHANPFRCVCACEHFQIRVGPIVKRFEDMGKHRDELEWDKLRCQHIKEAREWLLDEALTDHEKNNPTPPNSVQT